MTTTERPRLDDARTTFTPPSHGPDLLAEGLACVTSGRPLPAELRPAPYRAPSVATVAEGIALAIGGPAATTRR